MSSVELLTYSHHFANTALTRLATLPGLAYSYLLSNFRNDEFKMF
jgi:hypothetical protein